MRYTINKLDDYDKALKFGGKQLLCYSPDQFKKLEGEAVIVGEVNDRRNDDEDETALFLSGKLYTVREPGDINRILYACRGYISVGGDKFIALYKSRLPFLLWLFGLLAAALIALAIILSLGKTEPQQPSFHPLPPVDENADTIPGHEDKEPDEVEEGGGKVDMNYSPNATLSLGSGEISINFMNPGESSHDIVVELHLLSESGEEYLIAESGRIPAGSRLRSLSLSADPSLFNGTGKYLARYHLRYYDPHTGEKALVDSILDNITLKVTD